MTDTPGAHCPDTRYTFAVRADGSIFSKTDTELVLSDEGIRYAFKGRSGLRSFAALKSIRLQMLSPKAWAADWMGVVELQFERRPSLLVYSKVEANGGEARDRDFAAFVKDLHRRLSADDKKRIAFRRGISTVRHWILIGATAVFAGMLGLTLGMWFVYRIPFGEVIAPLGGLALFTAGTIGQVKRLRPGTYDPDHLPRDLLGPSA